MSLSCDCPDGGDYAWYYYTPDDYSTFPPRRRVRCCSCKTLISPGDTVGEFKRSRHPRTDIEERIYGECGEIWLAPNYMCETCTDLYYSLTELGYCITMDEGESMQDLAKQAAEIAKAN